MAPPWSNFLLERLLGKAGSLSQVQIDCHDWAFEAARKVSSNSQLYKQAGNSVTVPVIAAIAKKFKEIEEKDESIK